MSQDTNDNVEGALLAMNMVKKYPENFNHLEYIKYLKTNAITSAKQEIALNKMIEPFYNSLPSVKGKIGIQPKPNTKKRSMYLYSEEEMKNEHMKIVTLILKMKATVAAVFHDTRLPKGEHSLFLHSLSQYIVDILTLTGPIPEVEHKEVLFSAAHAISRLYGLTTKGNCEEDCDLKLTSFGIRSMLYFLVDFINKDCENAAVQMNKYELVSEILRYMKPTPIRRKILGILCTAVKTLLNSLNRASRNEKNHCLLSMPDVETLFRYLTIIENLVHSLPYIKEAEVVTLQCIERTVFGAMKYPLISLYVTRISVYASNSSKPKETKPKPKPAEKKEVSRSDVFKR